MIKRLLAIALCTLVISCSTTITYTDTHSFKDNRWEAGTSAAFAFTPTSTGSLSDINFSLRHTKELSDSTLSLVVATSLVESKIIHFDTISLKLNKSSNRRFTTSSFLYRTAVEWQKISKHTISIKSDKEIEGISTLSVEIANSR